MNILQISPYLPSLEANHAGGVCMGKQIETLSEEHNVWVMTFAVSGKDRELAGKIDGQKYYVNQRSVLQKIIAVLLNPWKPMYFAARSSFRFKRKLIQIVKEKKIDAIHAEYTSMGQYLWIKRLYPNIRFHLILHDVTIQSYERRISSTDSVVKKLWYQLEYRRIFHYERKYCRMADRVLTFSQKDKALLEKAYGVTAQVLNPYYGVEDANQEYPKIPDSICFIGQMSREENHQAAMRLISIVSSLRKNGYRTETFIIGNHPLGELKAVADEHIHVTGFVEDLDANIGKCQIAVFPLELGAGIKIKVLRAMALGLPVVTTRIGAEGIDENGQVIRLAETDLEFEEEIIHLLNSRQWYQDVQEKVSSFVIDTFSWKKSKEILSQIYCDM